MATDPSALSGLFKEAYGDDIMNLVPEVAKLVKMVPFVSRDKELGNKYHQPVIVASEHGVTYASADAGAFTLNSAVSMTMQDAQVQGAQMLLRSALSYDAASRASNSKKAFVKGTELLVENMLESLTKRLEIAMLYGGDSGGLGNCPTTTLVTDDSTHSYLVMSAGTWAAGIWSGLEGAQIECYANSALVSSGADSVFSVSKVDVDNRKIRLTGTATGISALDTATASYDIFPFFKGANSKEMSGLKKIITNTGALFNINATTYNLWKGNSVSVSGQLTMGKVLSAISKAVQRGLNEKVVVLVNPDTWANLGSDLAALRSFDSSYKPKKGESGFEELKYHGQNGEIEIISHNIVKAGDCFIFPPKKVKRIGAQEISFKTPGREDEIFLHLADSAGFELRLYSDQALFLECPSRAVYVSGFTNV